MPELPEVETVRRGLERLLPSRMFVGAHSDNAKSFPNSPDIVRAFLVGARVSTVGRRAKVLLIQLSSKYTLVIHLKMTGQLVFRSQNERFGAGHPNGSLIGELPDRSTRVTFAVADGSKLFFNDQRKFGWIRLLPTAEVPDIGFLKKVGPEPLSADFTWRDLQARLARRSKTSIKAALLDQTVIAGVGNIYADESLWGAKIHPSRLVGGLSAHEIHRLYDSLMTVLRLSIEKGGSTDKNYVDAEGRRGSYLRFANVFRRDGQPCPHHPDVIIRKIRVAGRGTHICPKCQRI